MLVMRVDRLVINIYKDEDICIDFFLDFDEQIIDDWDVDMSVYYEKGVGDKDVRDYVIMR